MKTYHHTVLLALFLPLWAFAQQPSPNVPCKSGTPTEQARCLLRPVGKYGLLGPTRITLPDPLENIIGKRVGLTARELRAYLAKHQIDEADLGGSVFAKISQNDRKIPARYFVIHDTGTPTLEKDSSFPADMNESGWSYNDFGFYPVLAHVIINRIGASATKATFDTPLATTQYEKEKEDRVGLFLSVSLIQPRMRDETGLDALAPEEGFTLAQYDRLALVYIAASVRKGYWLVPAFRASVDAGLSEAHDAPQRFDLSLWAERMTQLTNDLKINTKATPRNTNRARPRGTSSTKTQTNERKKPQTSKSTRTSSGNTTTNSKSKPSNAQNQNSMKPTARTNNR
ncbi:MAG TPA: hypothetical protein DIW24_07940 [Bacteroidetes bacterium]|nr:hypothetical protein [Bacteroidota bacterium]HRR09951.1 hypothetical protein [Rhodothermales bacterium]